MSLSTGKFGNGPDAEGLRADVSQLYFNTSFDIQEALQLVIDQHYLELKDDVRADIYARIIEGGLNIENIEKVLGSV
jgi:hypothetical protein